MAERVYFGLGSNLGDRLRNLQEALDKLSQSCRVLRCSRVYETAPWGFDDQPAFLNQVVEAESDLPPLDLLKTIKHIETNLGRTPTFRYGPRLIDIDILIYGQQVLKTADLAVPHAMISERAFVLVPLAELIPAETLPGTGKTITELLAAVDTHGVKAFEAGEEAAA